MPEKIVFFEVDILEQLHCDSKIALAAARAELERLTEEMQEVIDLDTPSEEGATDE